MLMTKLLSTIREAGFIFDVCDRGLRCRPKPRGEVLELIQSNKYELMAISIATITEDLPDDPPLRAEVHRLLDRADELDRAGDVQGMQRILANIQKMVLKK